MFESVLEIIVSILSSDLFFDFWVMSWTLGLICLVFRLIGKDF